MPSALWRRIGFTQRPCHHALVRRTRLEVMGTLIAARQALEYGMAGGFGRKIVAWSWIGFIEMKIIYQFMLGQNLKGTGCRRYI